MDDSVMNVGGTQQDTATPSVNFTDLLKRMEEIHRAKDADYSGVVPYSNFRGSEELGVPAHIGAALRLRDKLQRTCNLLRLEWQSEGKPAVSDEAIEDTLLDLANYALIVYLLRQEWKRRGARG